MVLQVLGSFMAVMAAVMASSKTPPFSRTLFPVRFNCDSFSALASPSLNGRVVMTPYKCRKMRGAKLLHLEGPAGSFASDALQLSSLHRLNQGGPQHFGPDNKSELGNHLAGKKRLKDDVPAKLKETEPQTD